MTSQQNTTPRIPLSACEPKEIDKRGDWKARLYRRFEPRTCRADYSQALSFEAHDPMWMLARQWQFGRFRGNDCGTAVKAKVSLRRYPVEAIDPGKKTLPLGGTLSPLDPWEPAVESVAAKETLAVRVESAAHLRRMIRRRFLPDQADSLLEKLMKAYRLETDSLRDKEDGGVADIVEALNSARTRFATVYGGRTFDGVKAFRDKNFVKAVKGVVPDGDTRKLHEDYVRWYEGKYHPSAGDDSYWSGDKLGYEFSMVSGSRKYVAENYATGHVGWYSFDVKENQNVTDRHYPKTFSYIPTPATFPGAPARRLWEYENRPVHFGNLTNKDVSQLASAVMMEYISLYSNDWMIVPVHTKPGMVIEVAEVEVTDCFGIKQRIRRTPEEHDNKPKEVSFPDRWSLYSISRADAYASGDFRTSKGLLVPASLLRVEESEPIESVQFMRDEMANMLWGVEELIDDETGGTMDGKSMSDKVLSFIDRGDGPAVEPEKDAEYTYLVQNRVPINWIPFLPEHLGGEAVGRDIRFRRGRMPVYYGTGYRYVRPSTSILATKWKDGRVIPFYVNEEEILRYGTKVILTAQRSRWTNGKSYLWYGYTKRISNYEANSGLLFDDLKALVPKK